jgi:hypothetical protein
MLIDFVWNVFKTTGSVDSYVLMKEIETKYNCEQKKDVLQNEASCSSACLIADDK